MVKLESLKKSNQFRKVLKEKKVHTDYFSIFAAKNFLKPKHKVSLIISFVMKKKIGNAVKRNNCLLYTSPSPRDRVRSRMPSSA